MSLINLSKIEIRYQTTLVWVQSDSSSSFENLLLLHILKWATLQISVLDPVIKIIQKFFLLLSRKDIQARTASRTLHLQHKKSDTVDTRFLQTNYYEHN
jgi:hypothetical protein